MPLAQAQALASGLIVRPAEPQADAGLLRGLAAWCLRYTPLAAPAPPDGIWLDIAGCAHLHGGETRLLRDLATHLSAQGIAARVAVADTPGMAHAQARYGDKGDDLPIAALRLPAETIDGLRLLGLERVGQVRTMPRAPLTRRFGPLVALRLDQLQGVVFEPIEPVFPAGLVQERLSFAEPLLTAEAFAAVIARLARAVCARLEQSGQGARRLDLLFERVDGSVQHLRIGTARPSRDPRHLARLLEERLERVDPGLGVEAMRLLAPVAERLAYAQAALKASSSARWKAVGGGGQRPEPLRTTPLSLPQGEGEEAFDTFPDLLDRLGNRLGEEKVYRAAPVESDVPERSVRPAPALSPPGGKGWPDDLPRPVRLLDPPQPVDAMALLPDAPPVAFTWRRMRHRVRHADGPERIAGEWWRRDAELRAVRDYFRVEDEHGRRFWLFRRGDGEDPTTGDLRWFLHGFF
jgi:protein ImuB